MDGISRRITGVPIQKGSDIVPIPGTKRRSYLAENLGALQIKLSSEDLARLEAIFKPGAGAGTCYPEATMRGVNP